ncbi:hypothetical protein MJ579_14990 [Klebsiella pneumoniae]|nr:hypothetical protein MJ579_14990 [Klebsiella pneumoniae]
MDYNILLGVCTMPGTARRGFNGLAAGCLSGRCGSERKYCDGTRTWAPRLAAACHGRVRIVEYRAGEGDQVGIAILQRRFRLLRVGDRPPSAGWLLPGEYVAGERQLVSPAQR